MYKSVISKEWLQEKKKRTLVFEDQKKVGEKIVKAFSDKVLVTLCAPPQWGKTGVSLYVSYKMSLNKTKDVFYLTGMSDKTWIEQTRERVLPSWKKNVYHRNTLHRLLSRLLDLKEKKKAESWTDYHQKIVPIISRNYVSFHSFMEKEKLKTPYELLDFAQCERFIEHFERFPNKRYHFIRVSSKGPSGKFKYMKVKSNMNILSSKKNYSLIEMNGSVPKSEINSIFESLSVQPNEHTIILIKDMLGAAKTIDDKYIGCVHESTPDKKDYSSEVQGLPGRLCGWTKQKGNDSPILFCNREIIETYLNLYDTEFSYNNDDLIDWNDNKVRVNMKGEVISKKSYLSLED